MTRHVQTGVGVSETLPEGFEIRPNGFAITADVNGGVWRCALGAQGGGPRRYWFQHMRGPKPASLANVVGFYAPDLAQARLVLVGARIP